LKPGVVYLCLLFRVKKVATGADFMCLLTDRGILLTAGSGAGGCLGHGNEVGVIAFL
jgi:hypothetical protein